MDTSPAEHLTLRADAYASISPVWGVSVAVSCRGNNEELIKGLSRCAEPEGRTWPVVHLVRDRGEMRLIPSTFRALSWGRLERSMMPFFASSSLEARKCIGRSLRATRTDLRRQGNCS